MRKRGCADARYSQGTAAACPSANRRVAAHDRRRGHASLEAACERVEFAISFGQTMCRVRPADRLRAAVSSASSRERSWKDAVQLTVSELRRPGLRRASTYSCTGVRSGDCVAFVEFGVPSCAVTVELATLFFKHLCIQRRRWGVRASSPRSSCTPPKRRGRPVVDSVYPLADAAAAHRRLESLERFATVVLAIDEARPPGRPR